MKPRKSTIIVVLFALLLAAFAIAVAQGTTQTDQKKKADACCAEGANCCAEGSCKDEAKHESCCKEGAACCKEGAECCKKHEGCCGESCELNANHGTAGKHDAKGKHDSKKHGECCKVKSKDGKTKTQQ